MQQPVPEHILQEMQQYYQARAHEYDEWFYRRGRYDHGPALNAHWQVEADEVFAALNTFQLTGHVLELAPGTGIWTEQLLRTATTITAVDASPEMIEINRARVASERVSYVQADLFSWQSEHPYDAVFFGFWISHVPLERLDAFLRSVATMLRPGGKVFFVDEQREQTGTATNQSLPAQDSQLVTRILNDGRTFEIIKNFYEPTDLMARCSRAGLDVVVHETATYLFYGQGVRR